MTDETIATKEQLVAFKAFLETFPAKSFSMKAYADPDLDDPCNTVACICGFWSMYKDKRSDELYGVILPHYRHVLYLQDDKGEHFGALGDSFFTLTNFDEFPHDVRKKLMLQVVDNLIYQGKPLWKEVIGSYEESLK